LQRSLIEYAQILLAMDELTNAMRKDWKIKVDTKTPAPVVSVSWSVPQRRPVVVSSPQSSGPAAVKKESPQTGKELQQFLRGTSWRNSNGFVFEWDAQGRLWHCKDKQRHLLPVEYVAGNRCLLKWTHGVAPHDVIFSDALDSFEQRKKDGSLAATAARIK
jgi:hypothetical protein